MLNRVAELGHFERLCVALDNIWKLSEVGAAPLAQALISAITGNTKLKHLDLSRIDWSPHLENVFQGIEEHKGLRMLVVKTFPPVNDSDAYSDSEDDSSDGSPQRVNSLMPPDYSWLERLLSRNRNISVLDSDGETISNGTTIDELYQFNYMYNRSTNLAIESESV